ncbi:MAG: M16 family metallopeptidase [Christensenellales bacterium]
MKTGLASIFSMFASYKGLGYFKIYAGLNRNKVEEAIKGIQNEISHLAKNGIEDDELEASREQLKAGFVFSQESTASRMLTNGRMAILLDRVVPIDEIINAYDSITKSEVENLISNISDFTKYSAVAVTGKERLDLRRMMVSK